MQTKRYSSYAEIEHDLKIIQLEREIHYQKIKLHLEKTKGNLNLGNLLEGYLRFSLEGSSSVFVRILKTVVSIAFNLFAKNNQEENTKASEETVSPEQEQGVQHQ